MLELHRVIYRQLYGVYCLSSTFISTFLGILGSLGIPFTFLRENSWNFIYPALSHSSMNSPYLKPATIGRQKEIMPNGFVATLFETQFHQSKRKFHLPQSFCSYDSTVIFGAMFCNWKLSMRKMKKIIKLTGEEGEFCTLPKC